MKQKKECLVLSVCEESFAVVVKVLCDMQARLSRAKESRTVRCRYTQPHKLRGSRCIDHSECVGEKGGEEVEIRTRAKAGGRVRGWKCTR